MIPNARPIDTIGMNIDDLYDEAKGWLDGEPITTDEQAAGVGKLLDLLRQAKRSADEQRATEKRPHDDAAKAVQTAWKPLLEKADRAADVCKQALTPFLQAKEAEQRAEAQRAADEAARAQAAAQEALRAASASDLNAREHAELLLKQAGRAGKDAAKLNKAKPQAAGADRAIGLRTSYRAEITDHTAFARWAWQTRRAECEAFFAEMAEREARRGPVSIPGVIIHTERKAA